MVKPSNDMSEQDNYAAIQRQIVTGTPEPGSILAKVMADLSPSELAALRQKAAEGMISLQLQKIQMQDRFEASSSQLEDFIFKMKAFERQSRGTLSTTRGHVDVEGPAGRTTITHTKTGCLLILTAIVTGLCVLVLAAFNVLHL